ncbi:hypothetical protein HQ590_16540 [bacterium]|nr:hypothetical protein [bacterium]
MNRAGEEIPAVMAPVSLPCPGYLLGRRLLPRLAWSMCLLALPALSGPAIAATAGRSPVIGLYPVTLEAGANFISAPLHGLTVWRGTVTACVSNQIAVADAPGWTVDAFGAQTVAGTMFPQHLVLLTRAPNRTPDPAGDWWTICSNTSDTLVVAAAPDLPAGTIQPGDEIELRRLISLADLFGTGDTAVLEPDRNGFPTPLEEDVIRFVEQTWFTREIFYHDGSLTGGTPGYIIDGQGPNDGSTITLRPGQPLMVFRKAGATNISVLVAGQVQGGAFTQRLQQGANPVAVPFAAASALAASGLLEAGWGSDHNGAGDDDDQIRQVEKSWFCDAVYHHDGTLTGGVPGWIANGQPAPGYALVPGRGYIFYVRGGQSLRWRHRNPDGQ